MPADNGKDLRSILWIINLQRENKFQEFIFPRTTSLRITYHSHGNADEFELVLENRDRFFSTNDSFKEGDEVAIAAVYQGRGYAMGEYTVDDISDDEDASGSRVTISGLASDTVKKSLRTSKTVGHENTSLHGIAREIAKKHGFEAVIQGRNVPVRRRDQKDAHDLKFLTLLGDEHGYNFRIRGKRLEFVESEIEENQEALSIDGLLIRRSFRRKNHNVYNKSKISYTDPQTRELIEKIMFDREIDNAEELKITQRTESREHAEILAEALLKKKNRHKSECDIEILGYPSIQAPLNLQVLEQGDAWDGLWHIEEATHTYDKTGGYRVMLRGYMLPQKLQPRIGTNAVGKKEFVEPPRPKVDEALPTPITGRNLTGEEMFIL